MSRGWVCSNLQRGEDLQAEGWVLGFAGEMQLCTLYQAKHLDRPHTLDLMDQKTSSPRTIGQWWGYRILDTILGITPRELKPQFWAVHLHVVWIYTSCENHKLRNQRKDESQDCWHARCLWQKKNRNHTGWFFVIWFPGHFPRINNHNWEQVHNEQFQSLEERNWPWQGGCTPNQPPGRPKNYMYILWKILNMLVSNY